MFNPMKEIRFLQFMPTVLLVFGGLLWTKTLVFDKVTNASEQQLYSFWEESQNNSNSVFKASNDSIRKGIQMAIVNRPDDIPLLQSADTVLFYQAKTLKQLEAKNANYQAIFKSYYNTLKQFCFEFPVQEHALINEKEMTEVLERLVELTSFEKGKNTFDAKTFFQNRTILTSHRLINYFASKVGSICIGGGWLIPELIINPTLKKGVVSKCKMFLGHTNSCNDGGDYGFPIAFRINGKEYEKGDYAYSYTTIFKDTLPKKIIVETDLLSRKVINNEIVESIKTVEQEFIINPFKQ